jgi:MAF protein
VTEAAARTLLLASASPRRVQLVPLLGLPVRVLPRHLDEERYFLPDPLLTALSVAHAKARSAAEQAGPDEVVVAADTVVALDGAVLAKPTNAAHASAMLASLRDREHVVATGVWLWAAGQDWSALVTTSVRLRAYADTEIARYVERGEPFDKAGGYAAQDRQFRPVERLRGCYLNVVGLPLCAVARGLETLGVPPVPLPGSPLVPPCVYCQQGRPLTSI